MAENLYQKSSYSDSCYCIDRFATVLCTCIYGAGTNCRVSFQHYRHHNCGFDGTKVKYSSNVLAAILSVLIACAVSVIYLIMTDTVFTMKIGVEIVVLMYLGFLISTVGYDKVIQMLKQIQSVKEETKNE